MPAFRQDNSVTHNYLWWLHDGNRALRAGDMKLVSAKAGGDWELYDLKEDRAESRNLAAQLPGKVRELEQIWNNALQEFTRDATRDLPARP